MDIDKIIKELYSNNKKDMDSLLLDKITYALNKYKVNDYIFFDKIAEMIISEEKYITNLKEM